VDKALPHSASITITTERPGILIGKRGTNIDALEKFLGTKVKIIEDQDPLYHYLIP
jgi:ribosomal protein S3